MGALPVSQKAPSKLDFGTIEWRQYEYYQGLRQRGDKEGNCRFDRTCQADKFHSGTGMPILQGDQPDRQRGRRTIRQGNRRNLQFCHR